MLLQYQFMFQTAAAVLVVSRHMWQTLAEIEPDRLTKPGRTWLVAAPGDELVDWREMVAFCAGADCRLIQGSDHGLSDFADHLDAVLAFAGVV